MPKKLTDTAIRTAKPKEKPYKMADGGGLYVLVNPGGGKLWRLKYRFEGKERLFAIGAYPAVSLKEARARAVTAKEMIARGIDPCAARKAAKAEARKPKQPQRPAQKQKKPSIRAQLKAAKEEQQKKPPQREKAQELEV